MAAAAALAALAAPVWAQPRSNWLAYEFGKLKVEAEYSYRHAFDEEVGGQDERLWTSRHTGSLSVPVWQDDNREWTIGGRVGTLRLGTDAVLPDSGDALPESFCDIAISTFYRQKFRQRDLLGGWLSVGSPSDEPFARGENISFRGTGFWRTPAANEQDGWLVMLNISNQRDFVPYVPLPGLGYHVNRGRQLQAVLGVPMLWARWQPVQTVTLQGRYLLLRDIHVRAGWKPIAPLELFAEFDWDSEHWYRHDRDDEDDRLTYYEKRVTLGSRYEINPNTWVEVAGGYAFDRFWFEGEDYDDRGDDRLNVGDGFFLGATLGVRY